MKIITACTIIFCALFLIVGFNWRGDADFNAAKREIQLRKIGHELLLISGDSSSLVLPVLKMDENEYQLTFQQAFSFEPDSLIAVVEKTFARDINENYIVNVLDCSGEDIVFGYAIFKNEVENIVPCSGRIQAKSCYRISIQFQDKTGALENKYLLVGVPFIAFLGIVLRRSLKTKLTPLPKAYFRLSNCDYNSDKGEIYFNGNTIALTATENRILLLFAKQPNTIIERACIQKEIWEDQGVIVGRSLDVFISKLRKKLEVDAGIQLINIHGKGYKLKMD